MDTLITIISVPITQRHRHIITYGIAILASIIALSIAGLAGIYYNQKHGLVETKKQELRKLGNTFERTLDDTYEKITNALQAYAHNRHILSALSHPTTADSEKINTFIIQQRPQVSFNDLLLVDPHGSVVYSKDEHLCGQNINSQELRSTNGGEAIRLALMTMSRTTSRLSFFPPAKQQSMFFAFPVLDPTTGVLHGAIALRFSGKYFYDLLKGFKTLGRRAELVIGERQDSYVQVINPVRLERNATFKPIRLGSSKALGLQEAVNGKSGLGDTIDYRDQSVLATWFPLVAFQLGLVLKIDRDEVLSPLAPMATHITMLVITLLFLFVASLILACCTTTFASQKKVAAFRAYLTKQRYAFNTLMILSILLGSYTVYRAGHRYYAYWTVQNNTLYNIHSELDVAQRTLERVFLSAQAIDDIAQNISQTPDNQNTIDKLLRKNMIDYEHVTTVLVTDGNNQVHAYTRQKLNNALQKIDVPNTTQQKFISYLARILHTDTSSWIPPQRNPFDNQKVVGYAKKIISPTTKQPLYLFAAIPNETIAKIVRNLQIGNFGYAFLFDHDDNIMYHPITQFVGKKAQDIDAQKNADAHILFAITQLNDAHTHDFNQINRWLETRVLSPSSWKLYFVYHKNFVDEYLPPSTQWQWYLVVMFLTILTLLSLVLCITTYQMHIHPFTKSFLFATVALGGLIAMTRHIYYSPLQQRKTMTIETSSILEQLKNNIAQRLLQKHAHPPYFVPFGIVLNTVSFDNDDNSILLQGHAWQKIPKNVSITPGFKLKNAKPQSIYSEKIYDITDKDGHLLGWNFSCKIPRILSPSKYPFDHPHIPLFIAPQKVTENIVLVPDFTYYNARSANQHIGIKHDVSVPGFILRHSLFNFTAEKGSTVFDTTSPDTATRFTLTFNIFLQRRLLEAFFIYFLPLFLMLIFIYSTIFLLWDLKTEAVGLKQTAKYASILFALLLLHRGLRSTFHTNDMLYLEWIFVSAYVTQIYLISYSMIKTMVSLSASRRYHPLLVYTFWPIQITLWIIITFNTFYAG